MTTIKTSCPVCGEQELTAEQMRVVVCSRSEWSFYSFVCIKTCKQEVRKPADQEIITLLTTNGGVMAEQWVIPAEALEEHFGGVISYDEILDFGLALETTESPVELVFAYMQP